MFHRRSSRAIRFENLEARQLLAGDAVPIENSHNLFGEWYIIPPVQHETQLIEIGPADVTVLPQHDNIPDIDASQGTHVSVAVDDLNEGQLVGTDGAGPCIAVVVTDGEMIHSFHFEGGDNADGTLASVLDGIGEGAHAVIAGGDGTPGSELLLAEVIAQLEAEDIDIDGYVPSVGVWMNADGDIFTTETEQTVHQIDPMPSTGHPGDYDGDGIDDAFDPPPIDIA